MEWLVREVRSQFQQEFNLHETHGDLITINREGSFVTCQDCGSHYMLVIKAPVCMN